MKFSEFSKYLKRLEDTPSRLKITEILSDLFKRAQSDEIDKICYLSLGSLAPNYKGIVFNLAEKMMLQAIAKAFDVDLALVKSEYKTMGDLGDLAEGLSKSNRKGGVLSVKEVYDRLYELAVDEGKDSVERKTDQMAGLLVNVDPLSARFIARIPVGKLRLGFSDKTILDALSWVETGGKEKKTVLDRAYEVTPDVGLLAKSVKENGIDETVKNAKPVVGIPVLPMLAQRLKSPKEMIEKMGEVAVEPKFDGLRVIVHFKRYNSHAEFISASGSRNKFGMTKEEKNHDLIKAFTRNMNDVTEMFPELMRISDYINADSVILDTEAVGMDPTMKKIADFQTTMKRRRVHQIDLTAKAIPLSFQVFDVLMVNGVSLMNETYQIRRKKLEAIIKKGNKLLVVDDYFVTKNPNDITRIHKEKISEGLEGVMMKKLDAKYVPGRTGWRWVKMKGKEEDVGKLADTVDCVVMGYHKGRGKRTSFGLGGFLVGVPSKSKSDSKILTLTKIGTGLTDEQFKELAVRLKRLEVGKKPKEYGEVDKTVEPDVWVNPELVVELAADEITKSPLHSSGYALRFPRLVKFRDDKGVDQATSVNEIKKLFKLKR